MNHLDIVFLFMFIVLCIKGQEIETPDRETIYPDYEGSVGTEQIDTVRTKKYLFPARQPWEKH